MRTEKEGGPDHIMPSRSPCGFGFSSQYDKGSFEGSKLRSDMI